MPKRPPEQRWVDHVHEQVALFRASPEFRQLRRAGLRALDRHRLFTEEEWGWWALRGQSPAAYQTTFVPRTVAVAARYGLAEGTVRLMCLGRNYRPEEGPFRMEAPAPTVRIILRAGVDPLFRAWVLHYAWQLGVRVWQQVPGVGEAPLIAVPFPAEPGAPLTVAQCPPQDVAFFVRVETPPLFPPEAAAELHRQAQQTSHALLRRLGYATPKRIRASSIPHQVSKLRLGRPRLAPDEIGDITEDLYGEGAALDPQLRQRTKVRRHRARRALPPDRVSGPPPPE
ncbi:MAG: hypothetical protein ABSF27_08925 [Candidatus Dormibacteria bacterium]|jgi:hypothetical protein